MSKTATAPTLTVRVGQVIADEHLRVLERCEREPFTGRSRDYAERELAPLQDTPKGRKLLDRMQGLIEAIGMPEPEVID